MQRIPSPILEDIRSLDLPSVPSVLLAFMQAASDESRSVDDLTLLVQRDPALAARILTMGNSAGVRGGQDLRGIKQSLQMLGMRRVRCIGACLAIQGAFARLPGARPDDLSGFWRHSIFVAELAQALAPEVGHADAEEAYLAGLLHDIGELLLLGGLGARYGALLTDANDEPALLLRERALLGTDHGVVGAWLIEQWQLPSLMADAVLFHHHDADQLRHADKLTRIVWAAHAGSPLSAQDPPDPARLEIASELLGIDSAVYKRLCGQAAANVLSLATAMGVAMAAPGQTLPAWHGSPAPVSPGAPGAPGNGRGVNDSATDDLRDSMLSMAALQSLQQDLSAVRSETELLLATRESARILFGVGEVGFFLRRGAADRLEAVAVEGQPATFAKLSLLLGTPRSACADAANSGQPRSTIAGADAPPMSVADLQVARALGAEGILCLPMGSGAGLVGLMVCGVSSAHQKRLASRSAALMQFAGLAARTLRDWQALREREGQLETELAGRYQLRGRQLAHEAGNPLAIIKNYLRIVGDKLPNSSGVGDELTVLREEIDRVSRIVRQLGEEAVPGSAGGQLDLGGLLEGLRLLYGESLFGSAGLRLSLDLQSPLAPTLADRDSVRQIVLNLWQNAADAAPAGSTVLTTTADRVHLGGRLYTQLRVSDNGPGLPDDVTLRLFQPLDPARRPGHAGLGLSIVAGLVRELGGHISCQSRPQHGTTFTVLLPQQLHPQQAGPA